MLLGSENVPFRCSCPPRTSLFSRSFSPGLTSRYCDDHVVIPSSLKLAPPVRLSTSSLGARTNFPFLSTLGRSSLLSNDFFLSNKVSISSSYVGGMRLVEVARSHETRILEAAIYAAHGRFSSTSGSASIRRCRFRLEFSACSGLISAYSS